jgi:hypothetical protein
MGFTSIADWADSPSVGKSHVTTFRKAVASAATAANDFIDYTYYSGNPPANFYASAPLVAAVVERDKGINIPLTDQYIHRLTVMTAASGATSTTNQNQRLLLADYLLYYPFVDTDAIGEEQVMDNTVTLPRYTGAGVQMMVIAQSAASTNGAFTINYTNQDGVAGRVSKTTYTKIVAGGGINLAYNVSGVTASAHPFVGLQAGDTGVQSVQSVTFTLAGGGLMAVVLVKPLQHAMATQECRRTTTGNLESYGAATQVESIIHKTPIEIKSGAVLGVIGLGNAGSLASSVLVGTLETIWS